MPAILRWLLQLGPTNPICVRLIQGGSRRARHNYIRTGYLAVLIAVLLILLVRYQSANISYQVLALNGAEAFQTISYLQIGLICILAPVFMAGAISQESNPRTWDILLTTPMSAAQIVLGNLFGRLFFIVALLLASLPLFAITQYFGGVPGDSILSSYAVAACATLLVGAVAITLAVNRLAGRRAFFAFYVSVVTYLALTLAIDYFIRSSSAPGVTLMTPINPFLAQYALLDPTGYPTPEAVELGRMSAIGRLWFGRPVLTWCILSAGVSVLLMAVSTITVRNLGSRTGVPWYRRMFGLGARDSRSRPARSVWNNPIAWREAAARQATLAKIFLRWSFVAAGGLWALALLLFYHSGDMSHASFRLALLATTWTELIVIVLVAVNVSATAVSREREDGTLDLILTTPITPRDYLSGKLRGLISYLLPMLAVPLGTMIMASIYVAFDGFGRQNGVELTETVGATTGVVVPVIFPEAGLSATIAAIPFIAFCVMVGLQWSLKSRGTIGSVVATVGVVGVIGGVIGLCGWRAGADIPIIGPMLTALNPVTIIYANVHAAEGLRDTIEGSGLSAARVTLFIGSVVALIVYAGVILGMRASMVRTFDMTVRRLAGTR
ncbi:MAG: ABC transporter permease subunit [Phycisphaerales bacterium]